MATPDNSPFKTPEKPKKEIKPNVRKVFKIAKNVGGKLFKLTMYVLKYSPFPVSKLIFFSVSKGHDG